MSVYVCICDFLSVPSVCECINVCFYIWHVCTSVICPEKVQTQILSSKVAITPLSMERGDYSFDILLSKDAITH